MRQHPKQNQVPDQNYYFYQSLQSMSISKRPLSKKANHPFPFSGYVVKSYSTENSKLSLQKQQEHESIKELNKYLNILEINTKMQKGSIGNHSTEFRRTQSIFHTKNESDNNIISTPIKVPGFRVNKDKFTENRVKIKTLSPVKKPKITDNKKIISSLRYQIISLYHLLGRRDDYMNYLKGKTQNMGAPLKSNQIEEKLIKHQESKGRDKGRVKFNFYTNQQLRSLKYKSKSQIATNNNSNSPKKQEKQKVHYDQQEQIEEEQLEEKEQVMDFQTWKRKNGVGFNQRVFIVKGGYAQLRKTLVEKGWYENQDVWSPYYDFKWTTRICDINYMTLKHSQGVNHFNNNHHLTSKYGLTRRLRTLNLGFGVDSDKFYPKCFDLGDQTDFENFVQNFKFSFSQSVAKRFLVDKARYKGLQLKVRITYEILKKRTQPFSSLINTINKGQFITITSEEWGIITQTVQGDEEQLKKKLIEMRKLQKNDINDVQNPEQGDYEANLYEKIDEKIRKHLHELEIKDPQFEINGMRNVWIAKPNFMSRGRGIRCFNNVYDIADYCLGQPTQFVVQKYIEHPLLIEGRKFDIRQWVLIQDFSPPVIWFYEQCYLRFSNDQYSLDNIYNRFAHLTNNSIQKHSKKHNAEKSMWEMREFSQWLGAQKWALIQQKMRNIVVWSIKSCQGHVIGKKGSSELVGYDFMIDENLNPWLIEINMSPSMDYSTPVTKKLVKMVLQDTGKILNSSKKNKSVGLFNCIYQGNEDLSKFSLYNI